MKEIYLDIKGYEGTYTVSNLGQIKNVKTNRILKQRKNKYGYMQIGLYKDGKAKTYLVHRLVLETFKTNVDNKPQINHINEIKTDNRLVNLEYMTAKENSNHGSRTARSTETRRNNGYFDKLVKNNNLNSPKKVFCITTGKVYESAHEAARDLNLNNSTITQCCKGKRPQHKGYKFEYYNGKGDE